MAETKKNGRPRKEVDWAKAEQLAAEFNTGEDIAAAFNMDYQTFKRRLEERGFETFDDWYKRHFAKGKTSLRKLQYESAKKGNVTMQIWLGKQHLDQRDQPDNSKDETTLPTPVYELIKSPTDKTPA